METGLVLGERFLRVEGEFTLPSICDDLFAWSSLLWRYPALRCLLEVLNEFPSAQRAASMRALANSGQPRFRLPCAEVLLPGRASPVAAPRLRAPELPTDLTAFQVST